GKVKSILSVDISAWNVPGKHRRKEAFSCTPEEIAKEVWEQLKLSLNHDTSRLRDEDLLDWSPASSKHQLLPVASYYVD
ncbi:hypothetical protein NL329_30980, partial [Klebsiella pneumoniae]|nr:hypothetical protein [Klebsiella pneumoniae]